MIVSFFFFFFTIIINDVLKMFTEFNAQFIIKLDLLIYVYIYKNVDVVFFKLKLAYGLRRFVHLS
jgi:hypothetical protein